jgi:hypothetical protein
MTATDAQIAAALAARATYQSQCNKRLGDFPDPQEEVRLMLNAAAAVSEASTNG